MGNETIIEIFTTENSSNRELGKQLRNDIERIATLFIKLDDESKKINISKKAIILEMADKFERLHEIGEYPFEINTICASIYRYLHRKGFDISDRYVQKVIKDNAPQYLGNSYQDTNSSDIDINNRQKEIIEALQVLNNPHNWQLMRRDQMQDVYSQVCEIIDSVQDYTDENKILVSESDNEEQVPSYDSSELDPFKDPVITDKPEKRTTNFAIAGLELGKAIIEFGQTVVANAKMAMEYPPEEDDREAEVYAVRRMYQWRDWWSNLAQAMKGGTDRKYRRSLFQWVKIAEDENDWGKHAASSKNPYLARFKDPKTGQWKQEVRKLTREQIGDKSPKVREFATTLRKLVPECVDFIRWSEYYLHPYTNGESVKLSGKLSDRSLR